MQHVVGGSGTKRKASFLQLLATPVALGIGLAVMAISLLAGYLKKVPTVIWHDGFATSCLLVWYAYWAPQFDDDAPMFFFFPMYYAHVNLDRDAYPD